jgi:hypothetical protein
MQPIQREWPRGDPLQLAGPELILLSQTTTVQAVQFGDNYGSVRYCYGSVRYCPVIAHAMRFILFFAFGADQRQGIRTIYQFLNLNSNIIKK